MNIVIEGCACMIVLLGAVLLLRLSPESFAAGYGITCNWKQRYCSRPPHFFYPRGKRKRSRQ